MFVKVIDLLHLLPGTEKISGDVLVVVCYHMLLRVTENACDCCFSSCSSVLCVYVVLHLFLWLGLFFFMFTNMLSDRKHVYKVNDYA